MNRSGTFATAGFILVCLVSLALGCWLRAVYAPEWLQADTNHPSPTLRPWMVEADCYSQMARVQRILAGQGLIQNYFKVENWPEGLIPSTTAPFDYCILLIYVPLTLFTKYPLDWAGALVSPLLWVGLVFFWIFFRSREFNRAGRALFAIGSTALPPLIWATAFGRPRHQSLILVLLAVALTAEYERWLPDFSSKRVWNIVAGIAWGMACWTSLFEPAFVVVLLILFNLIARRRESPAFLISFGTVMLVALILEGVHIFIPPAEYQEALVRWFGTIAELRGMDFKTFTQQEMTLIVLFLPFIEWRLLCRPGERRTDLFLVLLTILLTILAILQSRWIYYASLGSLFVIVRYCQVTPLHWSRLIVIALFLLGLADANRIRVQMAAAEPPKQPSPQLALIARSIDQPGGIMAPWWLSPGLLYFSGQPIVTGSSHCGISGIVDGAKFYTATSWIDADRILDKRKVRWVVVFDDRAYVYPVLNVERQILGLPDYTEDSQYEADTTVWQILLSGHMVPTSLRLRAVTTQFKLYEYAPDSG